MFGLMLGMQLILLPLLTEGLARVLLPLRNPGMHPWPRGYYVAVPGGGYEPAAGYPATWMRHVGGGPRNLVYANSLGMRDVEPPPASAAPRILVAGCSMTEGMGVTRPDQPWPRQFALALNERALNEAPPPGDPVVVLNGGVCGYNCFQMTARAARLADKTHARLWLLGYSGELWGRNIYGPAGQYELRWGAVANRDGLAQLLAGRAPASRWLADRSLLWRWGLLMTRPVDPLRPTVSRPYGGDYAQATREALAQFQAEAARRGVGAAVVFIPRLRELDGHPGASRDSIGPRVEALCAELGLPCFDPTPRLVAQAARERQAERAAGRPVKKTLMRRWALSKRDPHFNAAGNRAYAQALAGLLGPELNKLLARP